MKKRIGFIVVAVAIVAFLFYDMYIPKPLARDFKDALSVLSLSDMTELVVIDYEEDTQYRTADAAEMQDIYRELMAVKVKGGDVEIDSDIMRDDAILKVHFSNNDKMSLFSFTFYPDGYLIYKEQAMITKITMGRHVSKDEFEAFKATLLDGRMFE